MAGMPQGWGGFDASLGTNGPSYKEVSGDTGVVDIRAWEGYRAMAALVLTGCVMFDVLTERGKDFIASHAGAPREALDDPENAPGLPIAQIATMLRRAKAAGVVVVLPGVDTEG